MAILTTINGIPLFSTVQEALAWAQQNGLSGYHTHGWQGKTGYMGGYTHAQATPTSIARRAVNVNTNQTQTRTTQPVTPRNANVITTRRVINRRSGGGGY